MKFPNIIIIGAAKCGTTAMWYNLNKHPDISMALKSSTSVEMNFWKSNTWKKGIDWYCSHFENLNTPYNGEKSTGYYMSKSSMRQIKKYIPDVKLILCTRNPVDRAFSNFQMNRKAGRVTNFERSIDRYFNAGKYITHIENSVLEFFDKDSLFVSVAEHMKNDPTSEMKRVFDFIGVDDLNLPKKVVDGALLKHRTRLEDVKLNMEEQFYRVWSKHTEKLTGKIRKQLLMRYKPFNEKLYNFLGYEIEEWKV